MKRKRHSPEQIIVKLREADADLATGVGIEPICRKLMISPATYHKWRHQYAGLKGNHIKRLKQLEQENTRLKKLVADQALDISLLKEVTRGNF
jgi:transposase-like protein